MQNQPSQPKSLRVVSRPLLVVMGGLIVVSSIGTGFLYYRGVTKDSLEMELAKALLQVGVVSVAGTVLSILVFDHRRDSKRVSGPVNVDKLNGNAWEKRKK